MPKHSPAPWTAERGQIINANGDVLASVPHSLGDEQDHANAVLMAASPAMYETLRRISRDPSALPRNRDAALAAIAKAEEPTS